MMTTRAIFFAALLLPAAPLRASDPSGSARLIHASGRVTIESKSGGRPAKSGTALAAGDSVSTATGAVAVVELPDGSRLKLRESSRLVVTLPGPESTATEAFLSRGSMFAKVTKRLSGREFRVRTTSAVAAVRGTEFFTAYGRSHGKNSDLWVCVNEGSVELKTTKSKKGLLVPAGQGVLIQSGLDFTKPQAYGWTKNLNWNMDAEKGAVEDKTNLDSAYSDLLDQDYH